MTFEFCLEPESLVLCCNKIRQWHHRVGAGFPWWHWYVRSQDWSWEPHWFGGWWWWEFVWWCAVKWQLHWAWTARRCSVWGCQAAVGPWHECWTTCFSQKRQGIWNGPSLSIITLIWSLNIASLFICPNLLGSVEVFGGSKKQPNAIFLVLVCPCWYIMFPVKVFQRHGGKLIETMIPLKLCYVN